MLNFVSEILLYGIPAPPIWVVKTGGK